MRSKKAEPGRPSLHQTFASGGRPFLPPRATPLRFFRRAFLQKRPSPRTSAPVLCRPRTIACHLLPKPSARGSAPSCLLHDPAASAAGTGGAADAVSTLLHPPVWRDHAARPFSAAAHLQVFRQAFLQKGRYLPRRSARASLPPSASAAHLTTRPFLQRRCCFARPPAVHPRRGETGRGGRIFRKCPPVRSEPAFSAPFPLSRGADSAPRLMQVFRQAFLQKGRHPLAPPPPPASPNRTDTTEKRPPLFQRQPFPAQKYRVAESKYGQPDHAGNLFQLLRRRIADRAADVHQRIGILSA